MTLVKNTPVISKCFHCGEICDESDIIRDSKHFCCSGCLAVYEILANNSLCGYYDMDANAGISLKSKNFQGKFDYLKDKEIERQILAFNDNTTAMVILKLPTVHCSSCVWLLENFHKIKAGVISSRLNFVKKELSISYNPNQVSLKEIAELLATLGYEPQINLGSTTGTQNAQIASSRQILLKIGVVGFCAGNIMLLSFPEYFGFSNQINSDQKFKNLFLGLNFLLELPVFFYGAKDYLMGAIRSIIDLFQHKTKILSVDITIAIGITALFTRSCYETLYLHQPGYWDSLSALVLFLLVGRWVQQSTFDYLTFDRNFKSFFPIAVKLVNSNAFVNVNELRKNDHYYIHNQELIPADSILINGVGLIDYSFVTGEAQPVLVENGEMIFAGGRQTSGIIELEVNKEVSTSYLTQLWNQESFSKETPVFNSKFSIFFNKYFTIAVISIAFFTGFYWYFTQPTLIWPAVTAVLMVACPCALTLALPFTLNATMSIFSKNGLYVKNQNVIAALSEIDTFVFDKTGTLTESSVGEIAFYGKPLTQKQKVFINSLAANSSHVLSQKIHAYFKNYPIFSVNNFKETIGLGVEGDLEGTHIKLGNAEFVGKELGDNGCVYVFLEKDLLGYFRFENKFRKNWKNVLAEFKKSFSIHLISGDINQNNEDLIKFFGENIHFKQSPIDKLNYIQNLKSGHNSVAMLGDGLNDAGALQVANVGIALSEDVRAFSPSCDAILHAHKFDRLKDFVSFSKISMNVIRVSFVISLLYNFFGIAWAVKGLLSPVMAAIFMPISSLTVVLFSVGVTLILAKLFKF